MANPSPAPYIAQKYADTELLEQEFSSDEDGEHNPGQHLDADGPQKGSEGPSALKYSHHQLMQVGELLSSSEDDDGRASIDDYDPVSQHASDPVEVASTIGEDIDVWENLQQIFADMDAQEDNDENKLLLKEPLARLRRLLAIHTDVSGRERTLRRCHLGVLVERDWYLGKLREIEDTIEASSTKASTEAADIAFAGAVRSVLYEENPTFWLAGSKGRG